MSTVMLFEPRCHWWPKDVGSEGEYEDAYGVDGESGRLAVADGVSSGFRSRSWAQLLAAAVVAAPPDPSDLQAVEQWLSKPRTEWSAAFNPSALPWMQRGKYERAGGGYSTLQWVELSPADGEPGAYNYQTVALGDCCLFHIRDGQVLRSFPMTSAADYDLDPASLFSHRSPRDAAIEFSVDSGACRDGDMLVLTTDALGQWLLRREEAEQGNDWFGMWEFAADQWSEFVERLRRDGEIRVDDTTLVMALIGPYEPPPEPVADHASDLTESLDETDPDLATDEFLPADESHGEPVECELATEISVDAAHGVERDSPPEEQLAHETLADGIGAATSDEQSAPALAKRAALRWFGFGKTSDGD
jgi:hypothetical protein